MSLAEGMGVTIALVDNGLREVSGVVLHVSLGVALRAIEPWVNINAKANALVR